MMNSQPNPIDVQRHLAGVDYPADRDALVQAAKDNGADDQLVQKLEQIPERTYSGPDKVTEALFQDS
jgi:hypothetical protein